MEQKGKQTMRQPHTMTMSQYLDLLDEIEQEPPTIMEVTPDPAFAFTRQRESALDHMKASKAELQAAGMSASGILE